MTIASNRHIVPLFSSILFLSFFPSLSLPTFVNPLLIPVSVAPRWPMTETGYDSSPNKRKAEQRRARDGRTIRKTPAAGDTSYGMERMEAIPLWHGRGISRDLIERLRIFESIRRCVNSGSVSPARHTCPCFWTRAALTREGEEEEEEEERYGWKGTIKIFARARAYRGFGQARFFSFFLFFLLPRARSLIIQSVLLHLADESIKEERKRERKKCLIFAFEFINESLRHPRNDFERRSFYRITSFFGSVLLEALFVIFQTKVFGHCFILFR